MEGGPAATAEQRPGGLLRAAAVSRHFEGVRALEGVTLELHRHEVVGLIGPNGAGKTTLVNLFTGFDRPSAGAVELEGVEITRWSAHKRARSGLARTFQQGHVFSGLTVRENVRAQMRVIIKRILRKYGYPPDKQARATELVLEQAEVLCKDWSAPAA